MAGHLIYDSVLQSAFSMCLFFHYFHTFKTYVLPKELTWASSAALQGVKSAAVDFITLSSLPFHS